MMHGPLLQSGQTCTTLVVFHYDANHMSTGPSLGVHKIMHIFHIYVCACICIYIFALLLVENNTEEK